ncbi:Cytochrome P450 [Tylopilus felleus]
MEWYTPARLVALVLLTSVTVDTIRRILRNRIRRKGLPLPPGPTPLPFLGSVLSVNARLVWLTFTEWREKYGDIMYIRLVGTDYIVLSSIFLATELLERRSEIYSDRPAIAVAAAPYYDFNFAVARYGEKWRLCRRIFQQTFRANVALRFRPLQLSRARELVANIMDNPDEYSSHFLTFSAAVLLSPAYGYKPTPQNDPMVSIIENFLRVSASGIAPQKVFLIKVFPFLLHIPDWLPGSWIKRNVKEAYVWRNKMVETLYQYARERMECKDHFDGSMVSDHISRMERSDGSYHPECDTALKHASATSLNGNSQTASTLMVFTLAMVENPHVWKRAQADIDALVGKDRLPEFHDRPSLPYVDAIIREVLRWRPVLPLGGVHSVTRNDVYQGYYIPNGAIVVVNVWAISRDKARYPDGDKFIPERFLNAEGVLTEDDPSDFVFGFGRRICPGRYVADASLWSAIATMLATLDFNLAKDVDGNDIEFKPTFSHGVIESLNPFPCRLTPRPHVGKLLDRVLTE